MGKVVGEPYRGKLDVRFDEWAKGMKIESLLHRGSALQISKKKADDSWLKAKEIQFSPVSFRLKPANLTPKFLTDRVYGKIYRRT